MDEICDDYTPEEDDGITYYEAVLAENVAEYEDLVEEMGNAQGKACVS